jgi:pyruvate/2-oxoglutarate/acetoin dehydrogenase E1 component
MAYNRPKPKKYTKEELEEFNRKLKETPMEKGDMGAMIVAALVTIMPVIALMLAAFVAVIWFFFLR